MYEIVGELVIRQEIWHPIDRNVFRDLLLVTVGPMFAERPSPPKKVSEHISATGSNIHVRRTVPNSSSIHTNENAYLSTTS